MGYKVPARGLNRPLIPYETASSYEEAFGTNGNGSLIGIMC